MTKTEIFFAENINGTKRTGIIKIENGKPILICECSKDDYNLIVSSSKDKEQELKELLRAADKLEFKNISTISSLKERVKQLENEYNEPCGRCNQSTRDCKCKNKLKFNY